MPCTVNPFVCLSARHTLLFECSLIQTVKFAVLVRNNTSLAQIVSIQDRYKYVYGTTSKSLGPQSRTYEI